MNDYIKRDELLKDISESVVFTVRGGQKNSPEIRGANKVIDRIKAAPAADVAEVKHGEWGLRQDVIVNCEKPYMCSACTLEVWETKFGISQYHYCPHCGAKMGVKEGF